jgi:hypothetical protein
MSPRKHGSQKTTTKEGKTEYQKEYMREYRKRKKAELEELLKASYDPFMDSVVIPRTELEKLNFKVS